MGVGSKFFSSDECRILRSSRGRGCLRGKPSRVSLRFSIKVAAGGRFAAQIESAPKRNTTRVGGVSFCLVLTEKMRSGKCTTVQSVESSIMTTKPLTKSTSCCGSRSCGLYKIRPQRKGRQTCRFFLCDLKIMNLLQNQRGRCIDSGSQLLIEHIQTLGVSAE